MNNNITSKFMEIKAMDFKRSINLLMLEKYGLSYDEALVIYPFFDDGSALVSKLLNHNSGSLLNFFENKFMLNKKANIEDTRLCNIKKLYRLNRLVDKMDIIGDYQIEKTVNFYNEVSKLMFEKLSINLETLDMMFHLDKDFSQMKNFIRFNKTPDQFLGYFSAKYNIKNDVVLEQLFCNLVIFSFIEEENQIDNIKWNYLDKDNNIIYKISDGGAFFLKIDKDDYTIETRIANINSIQSLDDLYKQARTSAIFENLLDAKKSNYYQEPILINNMVPFKY